MGEFGRTAIPQLWFCCYSAWNVAGAVQGVLSTGQASSVVVASVLRAEGSSFQEGDSCFSASVVVGFGIFQLWVFRFFGSKACAILG